jgi:hypothetical protein
LSSRRRIYVDGILTVSAQRYVGTRNFVRKSYVKKPYDERP